MSPGAGSGSGSGSGVEAGARVLWVDPDIAPLLAGYAGFQVTPENLALMRAAPIVQPDR